MKTIKILLSVSMLLSATVMSAQTADDVLIDSVENSLAGNVCRTIVIDNQPERRSQTHLRVRGVDDSPIVIYLDADNKPKKQYATAKKSKRTKKSKRPAAKAVSATPAPKEEETVVTDTAPDTVIQEAPVMAQNTTEDNDNSKYYYGIGGILGGVLLMSPLYFRNRKKE